MLRTFFFITSIVFEIITSAALRQVQNFRHLTHSFSIAF